ncbi:hypothetical protein E4U09_001975 [Claviceps aff. purpurea]|uniref:Uncharacterized protein n=1 Tax=Claviceps aff. purpurea TaxID=1967640 RepID=A0A9P7QGM6_9HYPO|nr:hypothetical protein E4U09_001975 [Claviceps aff. purpurea]
MDDETWIAAGQPYGDGSTSGNEQVRAEQNNSQRAGGGTLGEAKAHPSPTTPMKHLQRTITIPYGPFPDEEDNAIERFPHEEDNSDDEVHNPTVVGSQWNVDHKGGD